MNIGLNLERLAGARGRPGYRIFPPQGRCSYLLMLPVALFVLFFSDLLSATDYYWWTNVKKFPTPMEVCQDWVNDVNAGAPSYLVYKAIAIVPEKTPDRRICKILLTRTYDGLTNDIRLLIARAGDSCPANTSYNSVTGICGADPQKGKCTQCPCAEAGDPINIAVGNSIQSEVDLPKIGLSQLQFSRSYNSVDGLWRHNLSTHLFVSGTDIQLVMADGRDSFFSINKTIVSGAAKELGRLEKLSDSWVYTGANSERFTFDTEGRLIRWASTSGSEYRLVYAGSVVTVTDQLGRSFSFSEDADHQPLRLTADGVEFTYEYNSNRRLIKVIRTQGAEVTERQLHYDDPLNNNLLTGLTDERGVRFATWTFDASGRATSSQHAAGAELTHIAYNADGSVTVTNELGRNTVYRFANVEGVKRVSAIEGEATSNCPMSNSTFTYDARGLLKTRTDNKGNITTFDYNARGLEVSRTEASGTPQARTTTTTWHSTFNLPLTVTKGGQVTTYTYDSQGRQTSRTQTAF